MNDVVGLKFKTTVFISQTKSGKWKTNNVPLVRHTMVIQWSYNGLLFFARFAI